MAHLQVNALPRIDELLWLQQAQSHRSYEMFNNPDDVDPLVVRRCDGKLWHHINMVNHGILPGGVVQHIHNAGFRGVFDVGYKKTDHSLITALVERWRPETHTFHFPVGEATITLEDVQVLYGLPIDGPPVTGIWHVRSKGEWSARYQELLGFQPDPRHIDGGSLRISTLVAHLNDPLEDNDIAHQQRARIYILSLLGGLLFADSSQHTVPLNYLESIVDLSIESRLSWGSAVLANLFRNLCEVSADSEVKCIQGCLMLLQYWAWVRMPAIAPKVKYLVTDEGFEYEYQNPYAARWNYNFIKKETTAHVLVGYRSFITAMESDQFLWRPYEEFLHLLPEECRDGQALWGYQGYIIFWEVVELHLPGRVARQLGYVQNIPPSGLLLSPQEHETVHGFFRSGRRSINWFDRLQDPYVMNWMNRANSVFQGQPITPNFTMTPDYMQWYFDRTVLCVTDPGRHGPANEYPDWGSTQQLYQEGLRHMQQTAVDIMNRNPMHSQMLQQFAALPTEIMQYGHHVERMNYSSQNFQFPDYEAYRPAPPSSQQNFPFGGSSSQFRGASSSQFRPGPSSMGNPFNTPPPIYGYGTPSSQQSLFNTRGGVFEPDIQMNPQYQGHSPVRMASFSIDLNDMADEVDLGNDDNEEVEVQHEPQHVQHEPQHVHHEPEDVRHGRPRRHNRRAPPCGTDDVRGR